MASGATGRGRMRASHADRELVIDALKDTFVHGQLTRDELDVRAGQALTARTRADLGALTADIPPAPPAPAAAGPTRPSAAGPTRPSAPARRRPLARAVVRSGICLALAGAAVWAAFILDPGPSGSGPPSVPSLMLLLALYAVLAGVCFLGYGVAVSRKQRRPRRQLPRRPGPGGHPLEAGQSDGAGPGPVPPGPRTDQTRADLRTRGIRPAPGAV